MLRRIQQAQQYEVATTIAKEKWKGIINFFNSEFLKKITKLFSVKSEIIGSIQQFYEENGVIQSLKNDLNYITTQRYQLVNMWFSRMIERKNDWNQTRTDMKDKLTGRQYTFITVLTPNFIFSFIFLLYFQFI